jgi:hypothetical protein
MMSTKIAPYPDDCVTVERKMVIDGRSQYPRLEPESLHDRFDRQRKFFNATIAPDTDGDIRHTRRGTIWAAII